MLNVNAGILRNRLPFYLSISTFIAVVAALAMAPAANAQEAEASVPDDAAGMAVKTDRIDVDDLPPGACAPQGERDELLVNVTGIRKKGNLRLNLYGDNPEEFLEKGKKLERIDIDAHKGDMTVCLPVPGPGEYALVVFHDRNGNGKVNVFKDGFGFSNNPKLGLSKPDYEEAAFVATAGRTVLDVDIDYVFGD